MRKASLGILWIALLVLVTACGNAASTSPEAPEADTTAQEQGATNNSSNEQAEAVVTEEPVKEPEAPAEVSLKVGDKFNLSDWEIMLNSFEFNQQVSDDYFASSADEGNKLLILNYTVTNQGTEADSFTAMIGGVEMKAYFNDKYEYNYTITMIDKDLSNESVKPLASKTGFVVIEVPDIVAQSEDGLVLKLAQDEDKVTITLR
ncbi:DUF4352 domain-containing protein [Paenibacillus senegalimassiliensis]|uniref:DUF4352 domain-containing protein n=1 Tax=Paenibacillus senegalimassiliensis TaxID=1737426 RepID=UPI00073EE2AE|nr:DUF4352 domain-containing protein [Paenibacillus senegalimassiliensis]